jgi:hypothetical protein
MKRNHFWDEDKRRSFLKLARFHFYLVYTYEQQIFIDEIQVYSWQHIQLSSTRAHSGGQPNIFCFALFQKRKKMVINRVLDYSDVYFSCLFFESFAKITVFLLKFIKWLFPCMLLDFVLCTIYMMYIYPYPFFFSGK